MSLMFEERSWDYIVKQTNTRWVAKTAFGRELAESATNTSLEDLINACITDKGSTPGIIKVSTKGADFNIDDPIQLSDHTLLEFIWPWNTAEIFLEAGSDCDMIQPLVNTVADVIIRNVRLNGNRDNNAGNIDGISWEIGTPAGGEWKMLTLEHIDVRECDRDNIRVSTVGGAGATVIMDTIRSFDADEHCMLISRIFDSWFDNMNMQNWKLLDSCASIHADRIYISGGFDHGLYIDDLGTLPSGPKKNIFTNIRVDNVAPGADADDGAVVLKDVQNCHFGDVEITNPNSGITDKARHALRLSNTSKLNSFVGFTYVRDTTVTTKYWKTGVIEEDTSGENLFADFHFADAISTDADDAEIEMRSGGESIARNCIRDGGRIARTRYL